MTIDCSRRDWLAGAAAALGAATLPRTASAGTPSNAPSPFRFCLNMSTIRGQALPPDRQAQIAAKAGYDAIEPWVDDLDKFVQSGGSLSDLSKQISDLGLTVESAIGFPEWVVDDDSRRAKGLEEAKRGMDLVRQIGCKRLASPPVGATDLPALDLDRAAERYVKLLEIGRQLGVAPMIEVWGFSKNLRTIGQTAYVALSSGQPDASVLLDVYHLYKGGSGFDGLKLLSPHAVPHFHVNDYPNIAPAQINDADRVFCGDGIAPLSTIFRDLHDIGFRGCISLELFNRDYWKRDAQEVATEGLQKMRSAVEKAGLSS